MDLINYFGNILAMETEKNPIVCKGLIRLALRDIYPTPPQQLTFFHLKKIFEESLQKRLQKMHIDNANEISNFLVDELTKKQSILTLGFL
ncbi:hypothetical protein NEF87_000460 [Candidatus Lokiarchaeum ossiferum]|uniref:Uncharacterized protein n=1 Tax=Candidatus Lokiarchaeum ossiferum TaxID=2951803 RepID=A0ABY6HKY2_9ARCH|nr:hypothetical protein NEF87_000460 [Candidatus Lokiarchaeum sp. B-35]